MIGPTMKQAEADRTYLSGLWMRTLGPARLWADRSGPETETA